MEKVHPGETKVGFIGLGVMGQSMATHILKGGYELHIFNRTKSKAEELIRQGAHWHDSIAEIASFCDVIITMIGFPQDVEEVYFAEHGLLNHVKPGTILIDMTTSSPELAQKIADRAQRKGCFALDAPVSGGDIGARQAKLAIMVGGPQEAFDAVYPLFQLMGTNIVYHGPSGYGQHCKMCNQIVIAGTMMGVCEALLYAQYSGLDPKLVLQSISSGAAGSWALSNLAPRILSGDFKPGFYVKHFIKDMDLAFTMAKKMGINLPALQLAKQLYEEHQSHGGGEDGTQGLFKFYQEYLVDKKEKKDN